MIMHDEREKFHFMSGYFEERLNNINSLKRNDFIKLCKQLKFFFDSNHDEIDSESLPRF